MVIKKLPAFHDGNGCSVVVLVHKWYMHPETKSQNAFPVIISTPATMPFCSDFIFRYSIVIYFA